MSNVIGSKRIDDCKYIRNSSEVEYNQWKFAYKLSTIIYNRRVELGLTIDKLAGMSNLSGGTISNIENGKNISSVYSITLIFKALGLKLDLVRLLE